MAEQIFEIGVKAEALYFDVFDKTISRDHSITWGSTGFDRVLKE